MNSFQPKKVCRCILGTFSCVTLRYFSQHAVIIYFFFRKKDNGRSALITYFYSFFSWSFSLCLLTPLIGFLCVLGPLLFSRFLPVTDSYSILEIAEYDENIVLCEQLVFFVQKYFLI